jgi:hypothetical protein
MGHETYQTMTTTLTADMMLLATAMPGVPHPCLQEGRKAYILGSVTRRCSGMGLCCSCSYYCTSDYQVQLLLGEIVESLDLD